MSGEFDKPLRILIAEDTRLFTQALRDVLEEDRGIVVAGMACNGQQAVEKAKKLKPDLIIMDINMPVMSGMEAIEEIMATNPTPILVVTANASQRVLFQAPPMPDFDSPAILSLQCRLPVHRTTARWKTTW